MLVCGVRVVVDVTVALFLTYRVPDLEKRELELRCGVI